MPLLAFLLVTAFLPNSARAEPARVIVTQASPLRFGTLLVPVTGVRTISAFGAITDSGLFAVGGTPAGPAQYTVAYDRGNESRRLINVQIQIVFSGTLLITSGGVVGRLSQLSTDMPSSTGALAGSTMTLTLRNCTQRICSTSFRIGGRLDVNRNYGGANLVFPLPTVATVTALF